MVWGFSNKKLRSVEDYYMIFKLHGKRRYNIKKIKDKRELLLLSFKSMYAMACLFEILVSHYFYTVLFEKGVSNKGILKA
jgi:hypothetical protein